MRNNLYLYRMILLLIVILFTVIFAVTFILALPVQKPLKKRYELKKPYLQPKFMPTTFVPIESHIVPTHASQTNKLNNMIGNVNSSTGVGPGILEVVIPSDFYTLTSRPAEHKWPSGSILPDYIYN